MTRFANVTNFVRVAFSCSLIVIPLLAQEAISPQAEQQIKDVLALKATFTPAQKKQSTALIMAGKQARGESLGAFPNGALRRLKATPANIIEVDIKVDALPAVEQAITATGGRVLHSSSAAQFIRAEIPAAALDRVAGVPDVRWMREADALRHNSAPPALGAFVQPFRLSPFIGAVTSQGYIAHAVNQVISQGINGSGVKVGVISDSASADRVSALIASGDLPPDTVVVPGQDGAPGSDEGTAMMEIVHDLAPGAQIFFATANGGPGQLADNIRTLRSTYKCDIIVDDVYYPGEGVFQDDVVAQAVNDVVKNGAVYFSSAGNSGNFTDKTSSVWEGDFRNGGKPSDPILPGEGASSKVHLFASKTPYDTLAAQSDLITLKWSDPLGHSSNDYDLFILDSTGTNIVDLSILSQTGTQDPLEFVDNSTYDAGDRIVVVLYSGADRALHLDANRAQLTIGTTGATYSHNAAYYAITVAATYWNSAKTGSKPFTGFANPVETFSSDGPRRMFFYSNGTPITPGKFLFANNGGNTVFKPDLTAADGVFTKTPGFAPFFGTSAAAPHAAAIAALVKSANPSLSRGQIRDILKTSTLDTMSVGPDRDSGYGIVMANKAVAKALVQ